MYKKIIAIAFIIVMTCSTISCSNNKSSKGSESSSKNQTVDKNSNNSNNSNEDNEKLDIVTTNQLTYFMVKDIVKDNHNVSYMFSDEDSQWNFSFIASDVKKSKACDIFIYTGAGFEPWISKYIDAMNKNKTSLVNMSRGIDIINHDNFVKYGDDKIKENPYYWMNVDDYIIALSNITTAIEERDPKNRDYYNKNFNECKSKLSKYEKKLKDISDKLKDYTFIIDGDKYDYLIQYLKLSNIKYTNLDTEDMKAKNEEKISSASNKILLYDNDILLTYYQNIIKKYDINTVNISSYIGGGSYADLLEYNISSLEKIVAEVKAQENKTVTTTKK